MDDTAAVAERSKRSHGSVLRRREGGAKGGLISASGTGQANNEDKVSF